jgi:hypothetical protein
VRDPVVQVLGAGGDEAEGGVEVHQVGLGVQDGGAVADHGERVGDQAPGVPGAALAGRDRHPPDPFDARVVGVGALAVGEDPQAADDLPVACQPHVPGARLDVPTVQLGVRALLLDDEHVDPQPQQGVQGARVEVGEGRHAQLERGIQGGFGGHPPIVGAPAPRR